MRHDLVPVFAMVASLLLTACDSNSSASPPELSADSREDAVREQLPGAWLREYTQGGIAARRLLILGTDGQFREEVRVTDTQGQVTEHLHEGSWLYDGTNLKRKYTLMDGKPPSRLNLPFVTFELTFNSRNEFTGVDHVHKNEVHYRRVQSDTRL